MKEELQGKLVEVLGSIQSVAGKAGDFAMEQLPDVAQSYVAYGRAMYTAVIVAGLLVLIATAVFATMHYKAGKASGKYYDPFYTALPAFMVTMLTVTAVGTEVGPFFLVWFAPKVWLLKEIAGMVR